MKMMRAKVLSYVLVVLMIMSLIPISAFASGEAMSDEFKAILNEDGKFVMNSIKPSSLEEAHWYFNETEYMCENYEGFTFEDFSEDFTSCTIYKRDLEQGELLEEHTVDIVYNYDQSVKTMVDSIVSKLPKGEERGYYYSVKDMELLSWWANSNEISTMIAYSSELKSYLNYKNFVIDCRMGMDSEFYTEAYGEAPFSYNDTIYDIVGMGVRAEHIIYVPDGTEVTKDTLMAAAKKRVDEYLGAGTAKITYGGQGIRKYYSDLYTLLIEEADANLSGCLDEIAAYQVLVEEETNSYNEYETQIQNCYDEILVIQSQIDNLKEEDFDNYDDYQSEIDNFNAEIIEINEYIDELIISRDEASGKIDNYNLKLSWLQLDKMNYQSKCEYMIAEMEYVLGEYDNEGGEFNFLKKAAGDYWFNIEIGEDTHMFIVVVDSDGMVNPQYKSSDVATDVTVSSGENSIPLDTRIKVEQLTSGATYEKIIKALNVKDNLTFDINLYSGSLEKNITKLSNGKFEVKIPVDSKLKDKSLVAYYVDEKLGVQEHEVTIKDGYAMFETDHFSVYTLAEGTVTKTEDNKITISEETVNEAIKNAGNRDTVVIPLDAKAENVTSVEVPVDSIKAVAEAKKAVQLETTIALVTFDVKALEKIVKDAGTNASITLNVDELKKDELNTKQQESIKDKTVEMVISAELLCNDKLIKEFGGGKVEVMVPFIPPKGTDGKDYKVLYVAEDGKIEEIPTQFKDNCIIMELEHFSEYVIVKDVATQSDTNVKPGDNANLYLWFGLLGIGTVVAYKARRKEITE